MNQGWMDGTKAGGRNYEDHARSAIVGFSDGYYGSQLTKVGRCLFL